MSTTIPEWVRQRWHLDRVSCVACVRALVPLPELTVFTARDATTGQEYTWDVSVAERLVRDRIQANPLRPAQQVDTALLGTWLQQYATRNPPAHPWHLPAQVLYQPGIVAPVRLQNGTLLMALIDGNARAWRARYDGRPFFAYALTEAESLTALAAARGQRGEDRSLLPMQVATRLASAVDVTLTGRNARATSIPSLDSRVACAAVCAALVAREPPPLVRVSEAAGIDALVRAMLPTHIPYRAASPAARHQTARSVALATDCARAQGLLIAFPDRPCPARIRPTAGSRTAFTSAGSSTWAIAALAISLGASALIYLPSQLPAPADWSLSALGNGWWST